MPPFRQAAAWALGFLRLLRDAARLLWRERAAFFPWLILTPWVVIAVRVPTMFLPIEAYIAEDGLSPLGRAVNVVSVLVFQLGVLIPAAGAALVVAGTMQGARHGTRGVLAMLWRRAPALAAGRFFEMLLGLIAWTPYRLYFRMPLEPGPGSDAAEWAFIAATKATALYVAARLAFITPIILLEDTPPLRAPAAAWRRTRDVRWTLFAVVAAAEFLRGWTPGSGGVPMRLDNSVTNPLLAFGIDYFHVLVWRPAIDAIAIAALLLVFWRSHLHRAPAAAFGEADPALPEAEPAPAPQAGPPYPLGEFGGPFV